VPSAQLLLLDLSNHSGRITSHDCVRWNTPGDNCPCAHHCITAYPHPRQENGPAPYPHIVLDRYRFGYLPTLDTGVCMNVMGSGIDLDARSDHDMVTNMHLVTIQNSAQNIQIDMIADSNVLTIDTVDLTSFT